MDMKVRLRSLLLAWLVLGMADMFMLCGEVGFSKCEPVDSLAIIAVP